MRTLRILIPLIAVSVTLALGAVVALAAPDAVRQAASPHAGAARAEYCPPGEKLRRQAAVRRYQRAMAKQRKAYFRTHKRLKDRRNFVRKQEAQLKALKRQFARCE